MERVSTTRTVEQVDNQSQTVRPVQEVQVVEQEPAMVAEEVRPVQTYAGFRANQIAYYIFAVVDIFILARFILLLTGANPSTGFVNFVYNVSGVFVAPFLAVFGNQNLPEGGYFESASLLAIVVYGVLAYFITYLITMLGTKPVK